MRMTIRLAAIAAATVTLVGGAAAAASASPAAPPKAGCDTGAWFGYEGTQVDGHGLAIADLNGRIVATRHPDLGFLGRANECFFWFAAAGTSDNAKYAVVASPQTGAPGTQALSAMWSPKGWVLGLSAADRASTAQQWVFDGVGDFDNAASGLKFQTTANGGPVALVPSDTQTGPSDTFTASGF